MSGLMKVSINYIFILLSICSGFSVQGQKQLKPQLICLDTCPKPKKIIIPSAGERNKTYIIQTNNGPTNIDLLPPPVFHLPIVSKTISSLTKKDAEWIDYSDQSAAGLGFFTNYTTEDGLALDAVFSSLIDQFGNIWFGTDGGGVSRYDGKTFTNFTKIQGLLNNSVISIAEDNKGNIWLGTRGGGVSCYDGKTFTNYTTKQGLASDQVNCIFEDSKGNIWLGTEGGISCYVPSSTYKINDKLFINFTKKQGLPDISIRSIAEDKNGSLWFGSNIGGVSRFDGNCKRNAMADYKSNDMPSNLFVNYSQSLKKDFNSVYSIIEDNCGNMWFGTFGGGIACFNGKTFKYYNTDQGLTSNYVRVLFKDKKGNLWIGTRDGGVSFLDINCVNNQTEIANNNQSQCTIFINYSTKQGLANNNVRSILEDKQGNLWFSTGGRGVSRYDGKAFINFTTDQGLTSNYLRSIVEDKKGNLWFGAWNGGVSCFDKKTFTTYNVNQGLINPDINGIFIDKKGNLWIGAHGGGVSCFDGKSFTIYTTLQGLASNVVETIYEDKKGNIWFGTRDNGVSCFDGKYFTNYSTDQGLLNSPILCIAEDKYGYLWFGTEGKGLFRFNGNNFQNMNQSQENYFINYTISDGLANNTVYSMLIDNKENIWIGTIGGGISRILVEDLDKIYNHQSKRYNNSKIDFKNVSSKSGLSSDIVSSIIEDKRGNIIIGTMLGFTILIPTEINKGGKIITPGEETAWKIKIFNSNTGFPVKDINGGCGNHGALFCDSKGIIWAGTGSDKTALVRLDLKEINESKDAPILILQSIKINNENICWYNLKQSKNHIDSLALSNEEILNFGQPLSDTERISMYEKYGSIKFDSITRFYFIPQNLVLPFNNNNITFEYAAIETSRPFLVKYQYMLEGYDKEWNPVTNKTSASFGNISEGTYTFKLKACSPDGIWSEPITYTFKVSPPWYRVWWMYLLYFGVFVFIIWSIIKTRLRNLNKEKERLEQKVKLRTAQLQQANEEIKQNIAIVEKTAQIKQQFLANMSHEIRTPMNVIMGMLNMIDKTKLDETYADYIQTIQAASENLLIIINDILDLNKIEAGKMILKPNAFNIINTSEKIKKLFDVIAISKGINFNINLSKDINQFIIADENRIIQIVSNLISNAFKFTPKGSIFVNFSIAKKWNEEIKYLVEVIDTGIGIKEEDQKKLFAKFSQLDNTLTRDYEGTGLGLAISKELAELMGCEIGVKSEYNKGSTFWFTFIAKVSGEKEDISDKTIFQNFKDIRFNLSVLLVEDKYVNQKVETLLLESIGCKVEIANNGKEAVDIISAGNIYDIVFMDIQMPVMDGVEAVEILRKNVKNLPPIIGLSANALEGDAEKYISLGMDDYIAKPFTTELIKEKLYKWTFKRK